MEIATKNGDMGGLRPTVMKELNIDDSQKRKLRISATYVDNELEHDRLADNTGVYQGDLDLEELPEGAERKGKPRKVRHGNGC